MHGPLFPWKCLEGALLLLSVERLDGLQLHLHKSRTRVLDVDGTHE